ncbi:MAG: triose-phosphate isomerase [Patescibacteria group bacterium]|nr:triose-phosphate isomerase [Patescibacteria group bacterium]
MGKKLIVANWKSNKNPQEAVGWLDEFIKLANSQQLKTNDFEIVICPPFVDLPVLHGKLKISNFKFQISLGSQNVSPFPDGSYTGEISAGQLSGLVKYGLIGHSERRKYFGDTTGLVDKKLAQLVKFQIKPIVCAQSLDDIPLSIKSFSFEQVIIMFEPASAISVNGVYQSEQPSVIKATIERWKKQLGPYIFLYGGSVNPQNAAPLLATGANGFVIGHASLTPDSFFEILKNV